MKLNCKTLIASVFAVLLLLGACGGGDHNETSEPPTKAAQVSLQAPAPVWITIALEGEGFTLLGRTVVRYGAGASWVQRELAAGQYTCSSAFFGNPAPGTAKTCEVLQPAEDSVWVFLADEWQPFTLAEPARVRYGAGETWVEVDLSAGQGFCTNSFFGGDPLPNVVKRCEVLQVASPPPVLDWVFLANEWQAFTLAAPARVRYGAGETWVEVDLPAGQGFCTNSFFGGDPLPGVVKRCEVLQDAPPPPPPPTPTWTFIANEWQSFTLAAPARVRYGAGETWVELDLPAGQGFCTNSFFSGDPLPNVVKRCEVLQDAPPPPPPPPPTPTWIFIADEGQAFALVAPTRVRYGAGSTWVELDLPAGQGFCTNAFFGGDPLFGVVKRCELRSGS